jgi:hypothetical protein
MAISISLSEPELQLMFQLYRDKYIDRIFRQRIASDGSSIPVKLVRTGELKKSCRSRYTGYIWLADHAEFIDKKYNVFDLTSEEIVALEQIASSLIEKNVWQQLTKDSKILGQGTTKITA